MKPIDLKPSFSDILETKTFFNSSGWAKYESNVRIQLDAVNYAIDELTRRDQVITNNDVPLMNELRASKRMLMMLLSIKEQMLEEVDPNWEEQIEATNFDVKKES